MVWIEKVNPKIKEHLELRIKQTRENKEAMLESSNPKEVQLWCAIANLSRELEENKVKIKSLEKSIGEKSIVEKKKKKTKKVQKEMDDLVKSLNRL